MGQIASAPAHGETVGRYSPNHNAVQVSRCSHCLWSCPGCSWSWPRRSLPRAEPVPHHLRLPTRGRWWRYSQKVIVLVESTLFSPYLCSPQPTPVSVPQTDHPRYHCLERLPAPHLQVKCLPPNFPDRESRKVYQSWRTAETMSWTRWLT